MNYERVVDVPPFPKRADDAHKGTVGRIVVVGGRLDNVGMVGAPAMVANAAFRTGCGLVQIMTPKEAMSAVAVLAPCATTRAMGSGDESRLAELAGEFRADVVAIGPGLSAGVQGAHILSLLDGFTGQTVVDADGLNALSRVGSWRAAHGERVVLTPHPGEMRRLLSGCGLDAESADRQSQAATLAQTCGAIVVHKGAGTIVSDGGRSYVNPTGNSGMATGGAGDVLTGVIAGLMGQGLSAFDAAVLAVYLHGMAGDIAMERLGRASVTSLDIVDALPAAIGRHGSSRESA